MSEKNKEKTTKIAVRAVNVGISKSTLPTSVRFSRARSQMSIFSNMSKFSTFNCSYLIVIVLFPSSVTYLRGSMYTSKMLRRFSR